MMQFLLFIRGSKPYRTSSYDDVASFGDYPAERRRLKMWALTAAPGDTLPTSGVAMIAAPRWAGSVAL